MNCDLQRGANSQANEHGISSERKFGTRKRERGQVLCFDVQEGEIELGINLTRP